jgi:hypothetical protein
MRYLIDLIRSHTSKRRRSSVDVPNWNLIGITFSILPRYLLNVNLRRSLWLPSSSRLKAYSQKKMFLSVGLERLLLANSTRNFDVLLPGFAQPNFSPGHLGCELRTIAIPKAFYRQ